MLEFIGNVLMIGLLWTVASFVATGLIFAVAMAITVVVNRAARVKAVSLFRPSDDVSSARQ